MKDYTFDDYRKMVEDHLMDFIPDIDLLPRESWKGPFVFPPAPEYVMKWMNPDGRKVC